MAESGLSQKIGLRSLMKVGDLVELSAHGQRLKWLTICRGKVGLVIGQRGKPPWDYWVVKFNGMKRVEWVPRSALRFVKKKDCAAN